MNEEESLALADASKGGALALVGRVAASAVAEHASSANMQALLGKGQLKYMSDGEMMHRLRLLSIRGEIAGCLRLQKLVDGAKSDASISERGGMYGNKQKSNKDAGDLLVEVSRPVDDLSGKYTESINVAARQFLDRSRAVLLTEQQGLQVVDDSARAQEVVDGWRLIEEAAAIEDSMIDLELEEQGHAEPGNGVMHEDDQVQPVIVVKGFEGELSNSEANAEYAHRQLEALLLGSSEKYNASTINLWNRLLESDVLAVECWRLVSSSVWRTVARVSDVFLELCRESKGGDGFALRAFTRLLMYESPLLVNQTKYKEDDENYDAQLALQEESCLFDYAPRSSFGSLWKQRPDLVADICSRHYGEQNLLSIALVELLKEQRRRQRDIEEESLIEELDAAA